MKKAVSTRIATDMVFPLMVVIYKMAFGFGFPPVTFGKTYHQRPGTDAILPEPPRIYQRLHFFRG